MKSKSIIWIVIVAVIAVLGIGYISVNNGLTKTRNEVDAAWGQVENVLQRRYDLVPNLVNSVKGSMSHEEKIFGDITEARKQYAGAGTVDEKVAAGNQLESSLQTLVNVIHENYPTLTSNENVQTLMTQLEGTENRIAVERKRYNDAVLTYNNKVSLFPGSIIANIRGMSKMSQFEAAAGAETVPEVKFD